MSLRLVVIAFAGFVWIATAANAADVSGHWVGRLTGRRSTADVTADVTQNGRQVSGSVTIAASDPSFAGTYDVRGVAAGSRWRLHGATAAGAQLVLRATVTADSAGGRLRLNAAGAHIGGKLSLARQAAAGAPDCNAVFTANQTFFTDQVLGTVLAKPCVACHTAGGLASSTRLRVTPSDPAATARSTTLLIDPTTPSASLLLEKPLALVPHGGGAQLAAGSAQAGVLQQWIDLVVQSGCLTSGGGGGGGGGGDAFSNSCASCHGADGSGTATAPDIRCTAPSRLTAIVRNGNGLMPAFSASALDAAALQSIVTKLGGLCSGQPADVYAANCASCHGADAYGGRGGPGIACEDGVVEAVTRGAERMPAFPDIGGARLQALASYVASLCHGGGGGGEGGD